MAKMAHWLITGRVRRLRRIVFLLLDLTWNVYMTHEKKTGIFFFLFLYLLTKSDMGKLTLGTICSSLRFLTQPAKREEVIS